MFRAFVPQAGGTEEWVTLGDFDSVPHALKARGDQACLVIRVEDGKRMYEAAPQHIFGWDEAQECMYCLKCGRKTRDITEADMGTWDCPRPRRRVDK